MAILYPDYKDRFRCLTGACPDSCCKAWEIVVDPDTVSFYHGVKGALGEKLRRCLATDAEGDAYFPLENGRCPFLKPDGLCEIHAVLGEQATSSVCRQFPDFVEEYEGFTERCPSLACPAAAELILTEDLSDTVYPVPPASEDGLLDLLIAGRTAALQTAARYGFAESAARIWAMAQDLQEICDSFDPVNVVYDCAAVLTDDAYLDGAAECARWMADLTEPFLRFLLTDAEILTEVWRNLLETALSQPSATAVPDGEQETAKHALRYFLYRYFLKPVNDGDILTWTAFILLSVSACLTVADRTGAGLPFVLRRYSKEIEHDPENLEAILNFLSERI